MLTLDDCIAFGELSRDVVLAIAEHMRVPEMSAVAIGSELIQHTDGMRKIYAMLISEVEGALARGDARHAESLKQIVDSFISEYPAAAG